MTLAKILVRVALIAIAGVCGVALGVFEEWLFEGRENERR